MPLNLRNATAAAAVVLFAASAQAHNHGEPLKRRSNNQESTACRRATSPVQLTADEALLVGSFDNSSIADYEYYYTHGVHVAGTNRTQAQWTADHWTSYGFSASLAEYWVYLNYPVSHSLSLTLPDGSVFDAVLEEDVLKLDPTTGYPDRIPTFHGYSASGTAEAEFVYVGQGQQVDFERLQKLGVPLEGKIAVAKYGGPFRGLKVKNSQNYGCIGTVIFTDPGDDGEITIANGYAPYPFGPARNPTSVQRGSVEFLSQLGGDPTTPGYPSKENSPRADTSLTLPYIPSLPLSYVDALPILEAMDGHGTPGSEINDPTWTGGLNVSYSTGPVPGGKITMMNEMNPQTTPIWNAIGIINGTNQDEVVVVGNHRDAWILGGAADPNSGSAIIMEMARAFGKLLETGWKPKRTIVLASWDGEEYGLLGSTEWVEEYVPWLTGSTVAYVNLDVGVSGPLPYFEATPDLDTIAGDLMKKVKFRGSAKRTLHDAWVAATGGEGSPLGSGSDYTAFLHRAGCSSIDLGATNGPEDPVYHYHSNYDSYHWMATYGDPDFLTHKTIGQYMALLTYHLSSDDMVPFDTPNYAEKMHGYYKELRATIDKSGQTLDTTELADALDVFTRAASDVTALAALAESLGDVDLVNVVNHKLRDFQKGFISQGGLPGREFFQHVVMAPGIDTGYAPVTFPGITEAVDAGDFSLAATWVGKTAKGVLRAAEILKT